MSETKFLDRLQGFGRKLKDSGIPELAGLILGETPIGKIGRVIKGAAEILGVDESPSALEAALETATPDQKAQLAEFAAREIEALETTKQEQERTEQEIHRSVTARHAADMLSDSKLSKNIRPGMCIALNAAAVLYSYVILLLLIIDYFAQSALFEGFWRNELARTALVSLWTAAGGYNLFYVGGRSFEKRGSMFAAAEVVKR